MHVWLFDRELQKAVEAELAPLAECHIAQANATWVPEFHRRRGAAERDEDSLLWKTGTKYVDLLAQHDAGQGFVITTPGELQGLLIMQAATEPSRLKSDAQVIRVRYFELSKLQAVRLLNDLALLDSACDLVLAPKTPTNESNCAPKDCP